MSVLIAGLMMLSGITGIAEDTTRRQVFIFGDDSTKIVQEQVQLFEREKAEFEDRDMVLIRAGHDAVLYKRYRVNQHSFAVVLVGKDGSEKYRTSALVAPGYLFGLVDSMPMRKREMRKKSSGQTGE